jgi:hypothetical protein
MLQAPSPTNMKGARYQLTQGSNKQQNNKGEGATTNTLDLR